MGWFSSEPEKPGPRKSADGAYEAPDRTERSRCWEARDIYYQCLDRNNIIDSLRDEAAAKKNCPTEDKQFEQNCATSWVKYFKQRRIADYNKEMTRKKLEAEGARKMPMPT
ncbi:hypothetical protein LTS18_011185, partial [Coniosporium uncinatum]